MFTEFEEQLIKDNMWGEEHPFNKEDTHYLIDNCWYEMREADMIVDEYWSEVRSYGNIERDWDQDYDLERGN